MAVTKIYAITVTPQNSLDYDKNDKEARLIKTKNDSSDSLNYVMQDKKGMVTELSREYLDKMKAYITYDEDKIIFKTITTAINCSVNNTFNEWQIVRDKMNKENGNTGNLQYCISQNFGTDIDPMIANEIGVKFAKEYLADYQCVVSTHINTGYVHNHIEFNATSFVTGKKYHDCLKSIQEIRKISDRLCEEYKLDVLEETRNMNLVRYKDDKGNIKFFEPTKRKNEIREGEFANKNDYRNTVQFANSEKYKEAHFRELKKDIDRLLPYVTSYEGLLQQLKNVGYEIKDKTKKGEWRKHISFKAPTWDSFTRDSSLGKEYEREYLVRTIEENLKKIENGKGIDNENVQEDDVQKSDIYIYGRIVIEDIDEEYRYKKKNEYEKVKRSGIEKEIIQDTKKANKEIDVIVKKSLYVPHQREQVLDTDNKRKQFLVDRINGNLKTLKFVEDREIKSFSQINELVSSLYEKRNSAYAQMNTIAQALKRANKNVQIINKHNDLMSKIEANKGIEEYVMYEAESDKALLQEYKNLLKDHNLLEESKQQEYVQKFNKFNASFRTLGVALEKINRQIREYDDCVYNISRVDKENSNLYSSEVKTYYENKEQNKPNRQKER